MFIPARCGETLKQEGGHPIINTPLHLACHPKGFRAKECFFLEDRERRVRGYEGIPGYDEPHKVHGSMNTWQECVRIRTHCVDLRTLGKSAQAQELGKIACVFRILT